MPRTKTNVVESEVKKEEIANDAKRKEIEFLDNLLDKRKQELDRMKHEEMLTNANIHSQKEKWGAEKASQENELRLKKQQLEAEHQKAMEEVNSMRKKIEMIGTQIKDREIDVNRRLAEIVKREQEVSDVNRERIEIHRLRNQVENDRWAVNKMKSDAFELHNAAAGKITEAKIIVQEYEGKNKLITEQWEKIQSAKDEIALKMKDLEIIKKEVDRKIAELDLREKNKK